MNVQSRLLLPILLLMVLLGACSKEEFAGTPKSDSFTANAVEVFQNQTCAGHTLVKPPVDILYLVDNSPSANFLTATVKNQLRQTIQAVSSEFDYHILVAPLFPGTSTYGENSLPILTNDGSGVFSKGAVVSYEQLNVESFFSGTTGASNEAGFDRVKTVINNYRTGGNPVFRQQAHTIVVFLSNGEDSTVYSNSNGFKLYNESAHNIKFNELQTLGYTTLQAQQFRFFSVVAHSVCQSGYKEGKAYKSMSKKLYDISNSSDQAGRANPDSYDLCSSEYASMYAGVNQSIHQEILDHRYDFWPLSNSMNPGSINTNNIQVTKVLANGSLVNLTANDTVNGFQFVGALSNKNTRYYPTPGEPESGLFVQLFGSARVNYPECVVVRTSTNIETYQYVVLPTAPIESSIVIRIRGAQISQGLPNGWTYEGFRTNQNIKDPSSSSTPLLKTGYFVKLNGSSKYVSGDTVESFYAPAPL